MGLHAVGVLCDSPLHGATAGSAIYLTERQAHPVIKQIAIKQMLKGRETIRVVLPVDTMVPVAVDL